MPTVRRMTPTQAPRRVVPGQQTRGTAQVAAEVRQGKNVLASRSHDSALVDRKFQEGEEAAYVKVAAGLTINIGNFQSLRVDVSVSLPCLSSECERTYETASAYVAEFLQQEEAEWRAKVGA